MGLIVSILPIIIIFMIIAVIVSIVSKGTFSPNNIFFKRRNAILLSYVGVLIIFTFVFFVTVQTSGAIQDYELNEKTVKPAFNHAHENHDLNSNAVKVIEEWTFEFNSEKLVIHDQFTLYEIDVVYTNRSDIKVTQYMMNLDHPVVKFIPPAEVWLQNREETLYFTEPNHYIDIKGVYNEFPLRQINGTSIMGRDYLINRDSMNQYFLVEVPKGVEVELEY